MQVKLDQNASKTNFIHEVTVRCPVSQCIEQDAVAYGRVACHTAPVHRAATRMAVVTGPLLPGSKVPNQRYDASSSSRARAPPRSLFKIFYTERGGVSASLKAGLAYLPAGPVKHGGPST